MERGLFWSLLLLVFVWLAWSGWNEYQKVEAYRVWAQDFEQAKYDIYAVLGHQGTDLTWGKPTRQGPVNLTTVSLAQIKEIRLRVNHQLVDLQQPPQKGRKIAIELSLRDREDCFQIPFTEVPLAIKWTQYLQQALQNTSQPHLA